MPLILVQELDKGRGGASLEELQAECPDDLRGDVFFGAEQECTCTLHATHMRCTCRVCTHSPRDVIATYSLPRRTEQEGAVVP